MRGLRDLKAVDGWTASEEGSLSTTVDPTGRIAIAVSSGDKATGMPTEHPRTTRARGPASTAVIHRNYQQLELFPSEKPAADADPNGPQTWWLLFHYTDEGVRAELSLPTSTNEGGHIDTWLERILLPLVEVDTSRNISVNDEPTPEIVVEVTRKSNS